jgi:threonine/homoserine/homoserine lactone efflux protein
MDVVTAIKDFGFPIVAAVGMLYMIYFVWKTITTKAGYGN